MEAETTAYIEISPFQEILSGMSFILSISNGVIKLTGPKGVGKTRLLQRLHREMKEEKQEMVLFFTPPVSAEEIETAIRRQLHLDHDLPFAKALTLAILAKPFDQQRLIIVFDDVGQIDQDTLLSTTGFLAISHNQQPLISLVLCGDESVNERFAQAVFKPLTGDLLLSYELNPLTKEQLQQFAKALLPTLGLKPFEIRNGVLERLYADSAGLPGAVPALLEALATQGLPTGTMASAALGGSNGQSEPEPVETEAAVAGTYRTSPLQLWQKPAMQYSALAAGLVIAGIVAWPRLSPVLSDTWRSLASDPVPELIPPTPPPPVEVAQTAPVVPEATPAVADPVVPPTLPEPTTSTEPAVATATEPQPEPPAEAPQAPEPAVAATTEPPPAEPAASLPEPLPAAAPAAAPPVAITSGTAENLEQLVRQWLDAWQRQNLDDFFSYYHTDFAPLYQSTRTAWREDRQSRISRPASIAIELEDFRVGTESALGTTVSFRMIYRAPNYADSTLKEVLIGPDVDGQWRILQEFNREVAALPRDGQVPQIATAPAQAPAQASPATPVTQPVPLPGNVTPVIVQQGASPLAAVRNITPPQPDEAGIGNFIARWLDAWQNQDVDGYFSHYDPGYKPASMPSVTAWREDRILKITRPRAIRLALDALEIMETGTRTARLEVVLEYHSTHYADRTLKEIELGRGANGEWMIVSERNRNVETLPLVRLLTADAPPAAATAAGIARR